MGDKQADYSWETLLAHAALLQAKIPSAILVGGTAAALHAGHRISFDHDHVIEDLRSHIEEATAALESIVGWKTKRRIRGKLLLGSINRIEAGIRNLRRSMPLVTTEIRTSTGLSLRVPTIEEMLRIKCFLIVDRNATRDYLDVAALSNHLGLPASARALSEMNRLYPDYAGEGGDLLLSIVVKLTSPEPYDLTDVDLNEYKGIVAPWNRWAAVEKQCRDLAIALLDPSFG